MSFAEEILDRVRMLDPALRAFIHFDAATVRAQARAILAADGPQPLSGLSFAIKDIIDTALYPTECGSSLYDGRRAFIDAASVAQLCEAGAIPIGKTVTTEFAFFHPGATRNPYDPNRTPGGSSSGSAVAVAAGLVDFALGSQTAASITRPAAYCGVMGYKPSFGAYSLTGVKGLAPSFDTLGVIARNVATLSRVHAVLANTSPQQADISPRSPRAIGFCRTPWWGQAEPEMQNAMERTAERFAHLCPVKTIDLGAFEGSAKLHEAIMAFEAAQSLAAEWRAGREKLSAPLRLLVETGRGIALADHHAHLRQAEEARKRIADSFEEVDLFFAPAAPGAAPVGLSATGNPIFSRMWTLLRLPTVTIQLGLDPYGMPLGGQLLGAFGNDEALLGWTAWLEERLPSPASPDLSRYMN